ncbi:Lipase member k [Thalictrum thalictroides]|uniref:Lipase member k n=1 Tax=Thalictrum thalictroides TaxID=46969 RepID=A0A7J6WYT1_THATH|nr:Lipase member k [Thalictrum thalictroides]
MQRLVDDVLAVTKESVKTFTYESLNNIVRFINGVSAILLAFLPGKASILENMHGWELRPTFSGPRLPRWMENGVSSFNEFIHELSVDSDVSSIEYSSDEEFYDEDSTPSTPQSQDSRASSASRARSFSKHDRHQTRWIRLLFAWILWPLTFILGIPFRLWSTTPSTSGSHEPKLHPPMKFNFFKDPIIHRTTDRRRGVVEDLHLAIEIFIEAVFDIFHKAAHCILSPLETSRVLFRWFSSDESKNMESPDDGLDASVPTATLGENDPAPTERQTTFHQSLNTDARTCRDVITELGYPYEAINVVTSDGYVLLLERIPRRDARKAVYLQHGIMDSSMGWVSNGVVGSPAFAAFDQGYDVFLGNFRGLVSREHIDKNISSRQYWRYSINEHGTQDIPAMIEKIHQVKTSELKNSQPDLEEEDNNDEQPYKLCAICHSLGGAGILMYVITRRIEEKPHRLSRLVLLSPAGFHDDSTFVFTIVEHIVLFLGPFLAPIMPGLYIPTRFFRMLLNKLARDFQNYPAVGGLVQTLMSYVVGGDSSNWVGAMGMSHYNMNDMPGVSFYAALHLAQMKHAGKFVMYDYGNAAVNMEVYGTPQPLDLGEYYGLIDVPVDLVAGHKDKVIRPSMVRKHYKLMKEAGVDVMYNEFEYAHLDFTFSHREELLAYVMSRLLLVVPPPRKQTNQKALKLKKKDSSRFSTSKSFFT